MSKNLGIAREPSSSADHAEATRGNIVYLLNIIGVNSIIVLHTSIYWLASIWNKNINYRIWYCSYLLSVYDAFRGDTRRESSLYEFPLGSHIFLWVLAVMGIPQFGMYNYTYYYYILFTVVEVASAIMLGSTLLGSIPYCTRSWALVIRSKFLLNRALTKLTTFFKEIAWIWVKQKINDKAVALFMFVATNKLKRVWLRFSFL